MTEYIEKEKLQKDFIEHFCNGSNYVSIFIDDILKFIDDDPTADVAEVKHGKWKHTHTSESYFNECWKCSVCGFDDTEGFGSNFCPDCGAKMDLED